MSLNSIISLFKSDGKLQREVLVVFMFINALVFINAILTDPRTGFDASDHIAYIQTLAFKQRLPEPSDTTVFYSPPLPYVIPALFLRVAAEFQGVVNWLIGDRDLGKLEIWPGKSVSAYGVQDDLSISEVMLTGFAAKLVHLLNWLFSLGLTIYLLKICEFIKPGNSRFKILALFFLGLLPVYYKSLTFIRGEPLSALLVLIAVYWFLVMMHKGDQSTRSAVYLGIIIGLAVLSKQWVFFILPAFFLFPLLDCSSKSRQETVAIMRSLVVSLVIAALIGGWFYISLKRRFGDFTAYAVTVVRVPLNSALSHQRSDFWFSLDTDKLFTTPVRPAFKDHVLPIFYSEMWGDYHGYFITPKSGQSEVIKSYLGRVNLLSLLPTFVLLSGIGLGLYELLRYIKGDKSNARAAIGLFTLVIGSSAIGYFWFLATAIDPRGVGGTIKATYMIQVFPLMAILAAELFERIGQKNSLVYWVVLALLLGIGLHNLPAMITHYILRFGAPKLAW